MAASNSKYRAAYLKRKQGPKPAQEYAVATVKKVRRTSKDLLAKETSPAEGGDAVRKPSPLDKKTLFIMRHGRTALDPTNRSDGWLDLPLSDEGRVRLLTAQQFLKDIPLTQLYAPDFLRTSESANLIASGTISRPEVVVASDDAKTWNLGVFAGTQKKPNKPKVQYFMDHPDKVPEGGESYNHFCDRYFAWLDRVKEKVAEGKGPILLVLSGSNLRALSTKMTGNRDTLDLDEGGLLSLVYKNGKWNSKVLFGQKDETNEWLS
jgi:broad specificity phosphatase PhoE